MSWIIARLGFSSIQFWASLAILLSVSAGSAYAAWEIRAGIATRSELSAVSAALKEETRQAQIALDAAKQSQTITYNFAQTFATEQQRSIAITQGQFKEVPVYVPQSVDSAVRVNWGFVRLFDAAVTGSDPASLSLAAGQSNDAASDVVLSQIAAVSIGNYSACRENADQLRALQGWVGAVQSWGSNVQRAFAER